MRVTTNVLKSQKTILDKNEIREVFLQNLQDAALNLAVGLINEQINDLCGELYERKSFKRLSHRAGSNQGSIIVNGQRVNLKVPRVKRNNKDIPLSSYQNLQSYDLLNEKVEKFMLHGVSTRNYDPLLDEISSGIGLSKSSTSRAFIINTKNKLEEMNGRDLSFYNLISIMIDGIDVGGEMIITAIGITSSLKKIILGIRSGATENSEICKDLLTSLKDRGLKDRSYLFVLDGSKALSSAVKEVFGKDCQIQRCIRHKERNIISYLPAQYHSEFRRRWKMVHGLIDYVEAKRELNKLKTWLYNINISAAESLEEANGETLTVVNLTTSSVLRRILLSTNPIESIYSQLRYMTNRIKRWRKDEQRLRWSAACLLEIEVKILQRRNSYKKIEIEKFQANLDKKHIQLEKKVA